ncbi:MAG: CHAT domain-containing protein [Nodosilinea sp.]
MIQEFHVSITPVGPDTYLLRTEAVAAGVPLAETQVTWPVDTWLAQGAKLFQDPLLALLASPPSALPPPPIGETPTGPGEEGSWIQLGQSLYQEVFQGRLRDSWLAAQGVAQNRRQPLRLRLGFKESRLQRLPWELLYGDDRPLATGTDVTLCRYYQAQGAADLATMPPRLPAAQPIQVLVVISAPNDQERLALRQEVETLRADLCAPVVHHNPQAPLPESIGALPLELTILEQPGRPELVQALEQGKFQVLHYAGHSDVSETGGDLFLVNRQTGLTDWLSGEDLAGLLVNNGIRLAVFNSCRGAYTAADDSQTGWREQNLVQALVNRGVPGVMAMAERIPDDVAITFTQMLYRNLQQGYPIDLCLSRVRQGLISAYGSDQSFWMLPVLYLRPDFDGYLYRPESLAIDLADLQASGLGAEAGLMAPDYSTDPDISSLAREVFAGHDATITSLQVEGLQVDATPTTPTEAAAPAAPDWSTLLDDQAPAAETAAVTNLVQQLSTPQTQATPPLTADPGENLLSQWETAHPALGLENPQATPPSTATATAPADGSATPISASWASRGIPLKWLLWGSGGLIGLAAILGLTVTVLSRLSPNPEPVQPPASLSPDATGSISSGSDSVAMINALQGLTTDNPAMARRFTEQLLDQGDLNAAQSVLASARPNQLQEADIAFVRGRLAWQQMTTGQADSDPNEALRAWTQATDSQDDLLEAWVALGFAQYALTDYDRAIQAWERAVELDRQRLTDIDPAGQRQVSSDLTSSAYAGLAMAYQKLSEIAIVPGERDQLQQKAQTYFSQAVSVDPALLNPQALALQWLWSPSLIGEWQTAAARLAVSQGSDPSDAAN